MKLGLLFCFALISCSSHVDTPAINDAGIAATVDANISKKDTGHICGVFECGPGCDACPGHTECGDNGRAGQCGDVCIPYSSNGICWYNNPDPYINYVQYSASCNYIDITWCILVQLPQNGGLPAINVWCCDTPDGGSSVVDMATGSANYN